MASPSASHAASALSFASLATVEVQLVMHNLDLQSLLRFARCCSRLHRAASADFAWRALSPLELASTTRSTVAGDDRPLGTLLSSSLLRHVEVALRWVAPSAPVPQGPDAPGAVHHPPVTEEEFVSILSVSRVASLDTRGRVGITADMWTRLFRSPSIRGLRTLLGGRAFGMMKEPSLLSEENLPSLTHLSLSGGEAHATVVAALRDGGLLDRVTYLSVFEPQGLAGGGGGGGGAGLFGAEAQKRARRPLLSLALAAHVARLERLTLGLLPVEVVRPVLLHTPLVRSLRVLCLAHGRWAASLSRDGVEEVPEEIALDWGAIWQGMPLLEQMALHVCQGADAILQGLITQEPNEVAAPRLRRVRVRPLHLARSDDDETAAAGSAPAAASAAAPSRPVIPSPAPIPSLSIVRALLLGRPSLRYTLQLLPLESYVVSHLSSTPGGAEAAATQWRRVRQQHETLAKEAGIGEHRVDIQIREQGTPPEEREN